ncbi:acyl-CoA-binding domain-containing protein 5-B [Diretmus argenteus]
MAQEEDKSSLEAQFAAAVSVIRSLPEDGPFQPSDEMMLMFCSYYKQATLGPCNIPRPSGFWDTRGKAKWDAWSSLGNMTKEEAMLNYVEDIQLILETIPVSDEVSDLVEQLGNFYTEVEEDENEKEENEVDKRPFTRPFATHGDWRSPDLRLLKVEDRRWRSETTGSSSSAEPTMSSFTNGTHSSLNSEVEEEELACSIEPGVENNSYSHFKGHLSDHSNDIREKTCRATDSDNEEFCDSMEHLAMQEGSVSQSPRAACGSQMCVNVSQSRHSTSAAGGNINEQIATVLLRLQDDMAHVLHRLHALEVLTVSQSRSPSPRQEDSLALTRQVFRPSWWPFHLSPVTVVLTTVWPLIVHWLVHIYFQRKTKKIS